VTRRLRKQQRRARNAAGAAPKDTLFDGFGSATGRCPLNLPKRWPPGATQDHAPHAIRPSSIAAEPAT